jgi:hypothetical protein
MPMPCLSFLYINLCAHTSDNAYSIILNYNNWDSLLHKEDRLPVETMDHSKSIMCESMDLLECGSTVC